MSDVEIAVRPDGPYLVRGEVALIDGEGNRIAPGEGSAIALCRCGASANKPFCDGSHKRVEFDAPSPAGE